MKGLTLKELIPLLIVLCSLAVSWGSTTQRLNEHEVKLKDLKSIPESLSAVSATLQSLDRRVTEIQGDVRELRRRRP